MNLDLFFSLTGYLTSFPEDPIKTELVELAKLEKDNIFFYKIVHDSIVFRK